MSNFSPLKAFIESIPEKYGVPAAEVRVMREGEMLAKFGAGIADPETGRAVSDTDLYSVCSSTKPVTCSAAMRLMEEGRLSLEDPVEKYLPAFHDVTVRQADGTVRPAKTTMTIFHLMTMQSGLDYNDDRGGLHQMVKERGDDVGTIEAAESYAKGPLLFEPGTHYLYSLSHDVLGAVIEIITGMKLSEYLNEIFFTPLGMKNTTFHPKPEDAERASRLYLWKKDEPKPTNLLPFYTNSPNIACESGGGGIVTTADDYLEFIYMLANGGVGRNGVRCLKEESIERMRTPRLGPVQSRDFHKEGAMPNHEYCLGVARTRATSGTLQPSGVFGWGGAAGFYSFADPTNRLAYVYAQNVVQTPDIKTITRQVTDLIYLCLRG